MKTIGLIGGMSFESTIFYYKIINEIIKEQLGGLHSSKCILYSVDFYEIEQCQANNNWIKATEILTDAAKKLELAGADFIVICTNTMHKVADEIAKNIKIPILHIATVTANALIDANITNVGLLGTKYTMTQDFYKNKLIEKNINVLVPDDKDIELVNNIIYNELCLGIISDNSKKQFLSIIKKLVDNGADAVILGCTEIGILVNQKDTTCLLFDTTSIHAQKSAFYSLEMDF